MCIQIKRTKKPGSALGTTIAQGAATEAAAATEAPPGGDTTAAAGAETTAAGKRFPFNLKVLKGRSFKKN
jgi:hypothetical protein